MDDQNIQAYGPALSEHGPLYILQQEDAQQAPEYFTIRGQYDDIERKAHVGELVLTDALGQAVYRPIMLQGTSALVLKSESPLEGYTLVVGKSDLSKNQVIVARASGGTPPYTYETTLGKVSATSDEWMVCSGVTLKTIQNGNDFVAILNGIPDQESPPVDLTSILKVRDATGAVAYATGGQKFIFPLVAPDIAVNDSWERVEQQKIGNYFISKDMFITNGHAVNIMVFSGILP